MKLLSDLGWAKPTENVFVIETQSGRAIIEAYETVQDRFNYRLELPTGKVVYEGSGTWLDAQDELGQHFIDLDEVTEIAPFRFGRAIQTLSFCQQFLSTETAAVHWMRLENLKAEVVELQNLPYEKTVIPIPPYVEPEFHWIQNGNEYYSETPYGRVTITETFPYKHSASLCSAELTHLSGEILSCGSRWDFDAANLLIKQALPRIADPTITAYTYDLVQFTLKICERLLPSSIDYIHFARLNCLQLYVEYKLMMA